MAKKSIIVSLSDDKTLVENVVKELRDIGHKIILGEITIEIFSDGESCVNFITSVRGRKVYILSSPNTAEKIIQLESAIDAARRAGAKYIVPIVPYFPYARQDKKDAPRGPIGAKIRARSLESLGSKTVVTFDLHADQIQGFFEIPVIHMDGKYMFTPIINEIGLENTILVSPDAGGGKRVKHFRDLIFWKYGVDLPIAFMDKTREKANEIAKMLIIGDVKGKDVIMVDDMCDTAGTLCFGAEVLMTTGGAKSVRAIVTHGVLSGNAYENIAKSVLTEFICSDTLPIKREASDKIRVISIAHQVMKAIIAIDKGLSIENLKEND